MRPSETLYLLKSIPGELSSHLINEGNYYLSNPNELRKKLLRAYKVDFLKPYVEPALSNLAIQGDEVSVVSISHDVYYVLKENLKTIDLARSAAIVSLGPYEYQSALSVIVKIGNASDLGSVARTLGKVSQIFDQSLSILDDAEPLKVQSWESGTLWVNLVAGSVSAVTLIGGLTWVAACAFKKYQEGLAIAQTVGALKTKLKMLESISAAFEEDVNATIEAEVIRLHQNHFSEKGDPETLARLQNSAKELFEMMKTGTEVHPSLMAPESIKNVFPDFSALPDVQKLLLKEDGDD